MKGHPSRRLEWYPAELERLPLRARMRDPLWFIPLMGIIDKNGKNNRLSHLWPEQVEIIKSLSAYDKTLILKPRQIGCTTIVLAYIYWWMMITNNPRAALTLTHETGAVGRCNQMLHKFWETMPGPFRFPLKPDNAKMLGLSHNGSLAAQNMAGGRGQSRSRTFQLLHCTEMGFWPRGSAVLAGSNIDEDAFASAQSSLNGGRVIIESTGNGPVGVFYRMVKLARESDEWSFLFFPWTDFKQYTREPPPKFKTTSEEDELAEDFGLTIEQIVWRRYKLEVEGYTPHRFRKEYPLTWIDPFLQAEGMWFDTENLNRIAAAIESKKRNKGLTIYEEPVRGGRYYIGVDTSGGTGRDNAVIMVLSAGLRQVAVWRSNRARPSVQADMAVKLSAKYNRARILTEKNGFGDTVIRRMAKLGAGGRLWKSAQGKDFWTQSGNSRTKKALYDWAQELVDNNEVEILDPVTVGELVTIREKENGKIEADGKGHDDHADALCLALWNARKQFNSSRRRRPMSLEARRRLRHKNPNLRIT